MVLRVGNAGPGTAYRVVANLVPAQDYEVLQGSADVSSIAPGTSKEVEFTLKPVAEEVLRLRFQVNYSDQERKGTHRYDTTRTFHAATSGYSPLCFDLYRPEAPGERSLHPALPVPSSFYPAPAVS